MFTIAHGSGLITDVDPGARGATGWTGTGMVTGGAWTAVGDCGADGAGADGWGGNSCQGEIP
ncbi:MAG: hypothetical protein HYR86_07220 [Candidatus Rokubacteria bacterium]|nr:hypothetical protein [Candidatus Rokubacteria bacterium]